MPIKTVGFRLRNIPARIGTVQPAFLRDKQPRSQDSTPRLSGQKAYDRRNRWLDKHPLCCLCEALGTTTAGQEVDHVIPLWKGGADDESNFQTLCKPCHRNKTDRENGYRYGNPHIPPLGEP